MNMPLCSWALFLSFLSSLIIAAPTVLYYLFGWLNWRLNGVKSYYIEKMKLLIFFFGWIPLTKLCGYFICYSRSPGSRLILQHVNGFSHFPAPQPMSWSVHPEWFLRSLLCHCNNISAGPLVLAHMGPVVTLGCLNLYPKLLGTQIFKETIRRRSARLPCLCRRGSLIYTSV